jgi:hypothetical protein
MTQSRPTKKLAGGAPGAKALITAASLALAIGGWAGLARTQPAPASAGPTGNASSGAAAPSVDPGLGPLPTIVPPPALDIASVGGSPVGRSPVAAPQASLPLRSVSAPRPVARTRSSR